MNTQVESEKSGVVARLITFAADSRTGTLLVSGLITTLMMRNYIWPLNSLLYTVGIKGQDVDQMVWNLWFANEAITSGHSPFHTNLLYYPLGANLAHHTLAAGFFPLTFLVKKLSGNDPLYPIYSFKIIILVSFTLILWLSYLTLREMGLSRWSSLIPAIGYAFSDFYVLHVIHINHLAGFFIPLTALFLVRAYKQPASANVPIAAVTAAISIYFTEFSAFIVMAIFLFALAASLTGSGRRTLVERLRAAGTRRLAVAAIVYLIIVAPFLFNLSRDHVRKPPHDEQSLYSANLAGFFIPGQEKDQEELHGAPLTTPLYGTAFVPLDSRITVGVGGFETFVGFPVLLLGLIALAISRPKLAWLSAATGLVFFLLSLGPTLKVFGTDTGVPMPYAALMKVPPFDSGRTPVRFEVMALFFLMIVAACGASWLEARLSTRFGRRWSWVAMLFLFTWTTAEAYMPQARRPRFAPPAALSQIPPGPVFNLPPIQWDGYAAMLQTFHHQPISTGYLARNSELQWARFTELKTAFDKGTSFCDYLQKAGFRTVIIAPESVFLPYRYSMVPLDLSRCPIKIIDLRASGENSDAPKNYPPYRLGTRVDFGSVEAEQYLWYGWSGREVLSHWTSRGRAALIFSLETPPSGHRVTLSIFGTPFLAPGQLNSQRVTVKLNDEQIADWSLRNSEPELHSIEVPVSALRDRNVLTFILPDATSPQALEISEDRRLLGFNLQWISLAETAPGSKTEK